MEYHTDPPSCEVSETKTNLERAVPSATAEATTMEGWKILRDPTDQIQGPLLSMQS